MSEASEILEGVHVPSWFLIFLTLLGIRIVLLKIPFTKTQNIILAFNWVKEPMSFKTQFTINPKSHSIPSAFNRKLASEQFPKF